MSSQPPASQHAQDAAELHSSKATWRPSDHEARWQAAWELAQVHRPNGSGPKQYILEMWPYPSGDLHMGHVRNYTLGDVFARFARLTGADVLHPMGWDALGLPAENQAIAEQVAPQVRTPQNIARMRQQMQRLGLSYDWSRELNSSEPDYYRWNQWLFVKLFEQNLIYRRNSEVNFCPGCQTVLANEQVLDDNICWRGHTGVTQRTIAEWAFRITAYAEELLAGLDGLTQWPERIVQQQRNWIGKSVGTQLTFVVEVPGAKATELTVFTTRIDTVMGCTYVVVAPEHPLVEAVLASADASHAKGVRAFVERIRHQDQEERTAVGRSKEGVALGAQAVHPLTNERLPIWLGNFVLAHYGTGAVMAVPAHDARDHAFATAYALPIRRAIKAAPDAPKSEELPYLGDGELIDAHQFSGLQSAEARHKITTWAEQRGAGRATTSYHLRDWGFSRQRYWGTPIPIIYCDEHGAVPVPIDQLPVRLPNFADVSLTGQGGAPLSKLPSFVDTQCPTCGKASRREVDTMDTFVDSAWYQTRFTSPHHNICPVDRAAADTWLPVNLYVGGPEHAVMHLLYFRFFCRAMRDLGLIGTDEPVQRLLTQGMVHAPSYRCKDHGYIPAADLTNLPRDQLLCPKCSLPLRVAVEKMSKSKYNGIDPMALINQYGADTARLYILFAAPPEKDLEWNHDGIEGQARFVQRVWRLADAQSEAAKAAKPDVKASMQGLDAAATAVRRTLHRTLERVTAEMTSRNHFNTAIAALMTLVNVAYEHRLGGDKATALPPEVARELLGILAQMLAPLAPHLAESVWEASGNTGLVATSRWPSPDAAALVDNETTIAVQVSGKLRAQVLIGKDAPAEVLVKAAKQDPNVARYLAGQTVLKEVVVPNRLVNFVIKPSS